MLRWPLPLMLRWPLPEFERTDESDSLADGEQLQKAKANAESDVAAALKSVISSRLRLFIKLIGLKGSVAFVLVFEGQLLVEKVVDTDTRDDPLPRQAIRASIWSNTSFLH